MYLVYVYFFCFKVIKRILFYLRREKKKEKKKERKTKWWARGREKKEKKKKKEFSLVMIQLIYEKTIQKCYLKTKNWYG